MSATTRHVLGTLSIHMQSDGQGAFPSEARLAEETGLSERAVRKHLRIASRDGWVGRKLWRQRGKNWAQYSYCATLPRGIDAPELGSAPMDNAPARHANGPEPGSNLVRNDVPTNSTGNSTKNSIEVTPGQRQKRRQQVKDIIAEMGGFMTARAKAKV